MRPLLSLLIYSNTWVALCFSVLLYGISNYYGVKNVYLFTLWGFTGTVTSYQLHRIIRLKQLYHTVRSNRRLLWMQNTYYFQLIWLICNLLCFLVFTFMIPFNLPSLILILFNGLVVGLYAFPLPIIGNGIRNLPFAKNILICLSWTSVIIIPLAEENIPFDWSVPCLIFIAVFAQIIPFDNRDLQHDPPTMRTIPQLVGTKAAQVIGFSLLLISCYIQFELLGFHWIFIGILISGIIGHLFSFKIGYQLRQEFMWELPLGLMGLWFLFA